jgi:HEAT repeats
LLLALACGRVDHSAQSGRASPRPEAAAPAAGQAEAGLPARGEVEVSFGAAGIVARANQASRRSVLEAIARETGLVIVAFVDGGDPEGSVTLSSEGEPIEVVLARALSGVPFSIEPLDTGGRARLTLVVGRSRPPPERSREAARMATRRSVLDPRERVERAQRVDELEAEALAKLESSDPRERAEGVEWADISMVAGYEAVIERLANDPDATVRAAAAESLSSADVGAVRPLVTALADPDARVVISALESLEMLGDASIIAELGPALEHPDPAVRERAEEAAEFLE